MMGRTLAIPIYKALLCFVIKLHSTLNYVDDKLYKNYYLQQVIQVIVNSCHLSLDTVLAEWSSQLGKDVIYHLQEDSCRSEREREVGGGRGDE